MQIFHGTTAHGGAVYGIVREYNGNDTTKTDKSVFIDDASLKNERFRFLRARVNVDLKLKELSKKASEEMGKSVGQVFEGTRMFLRDGSFIGEILTLISDEHMSAERAVETIGNHYAEEFSNLEDEYMRARSEDILEVTRMILEALNKNKDEGVNEEIADDSESIIILKDSMSAAELMELNFTKVRGIILRKGSTLSHASILAHSRGIPMIVCCDVENVNGHPAVINGDEGLVYIDPDRSILKEFGQRKLSDVFIDSGKTFRVVDRDRRIKYFVNVGNPVDVSKAIHFGAAGIGLFRSEFLYFGRSMPPTEDELFDRFKNALTKMGSKPVTVRTIDFGADKVPSYIEIKNNERGLAFSLKERKLLKTELRALFRASAYGNLQIMYPMVNNLSEIKEVNALIAEVKRELTYERKDFRRTLPIGIMVETIEALDNIEELSKEAKFFSVGTNDLTHYLLGISREDFSTASLTVGEKEKIKEAIKKIVDAGNKADIPVCICGEIASDMKWADEFVKLGVTALSISL